MERPGDLQLYLGLSVLNLDPKLARKGARWGCVAFPPPLKLI